MSRYSFTLFGLVLMTAFGIFFGIEIATRGMERIQGPITAVDGGQPVVESHAPLPNGTAGTGRSGGGGQTATPSNANQGSAGINSAVGGKSGTTGANSQTGAKPTPTPLPPIGAGALGPSADSGVNRLGNGIGDLLQGAAHGTIRTVVGLFDGLVD